MTFWRFAPGEVEDGFGILFFFVVFLLCIFRNKKRRIIVIFISHCSIAFCLFYWLFNLIFFHWF